MKLIDRSGLKTKNNLSYFEDPDIARLGWIRHAFLTRLGGVSPSPYASLNLGRKSGDREDHVNKNRDIIAKAFEFDPKRLIRPNQIHQDNILLLRELSGPLPALLEYDALITNAPNTYLSIRTADCLPILMADQSKKVIAAVHAGRQGTSLHIVQKVILKMEEEFGCKSEDIMVTLGPAIGSCCYEIDEKVFHPEWIPFSVSKGEGKWTIDLAQINIHQVQNKGIKEDQISRVNLCTRCQKDLFFSYRGEGQTGRQLAFIGIV